MATIKELDPIKDRLICYILKKAMDLEWGGIIDLNDCIRIYEKDWRWIFMGHEATEE